MPANRRKKYEIVRVKNVRFSLALKYIPEAYVELWKDRTPQELIGSSIASHQDEPAVIAMNKGETVGFISYYYWASDLAIFISLAYVRPEYRRQGVHKQLFEELKKIAKEKEIMVISSAVALSNEASIASMKSQGRTLTSYNVDFLMPWK